MKFFDPLSTHSSPSSTAVVLVPPASDPAPASDQDIIRDRPIGGDVPGGYNGFLSDLGEFVFNFSFDNNQDGTENVSSPFHEADQVTIQVSPIPMIETYGVKLDPIAGLVFDPVPTFDDWLIPNIGVPAVQPWFQWIDTCARSRFQTCHHRQ